MGHEGTFSRRRFLQSGGTLGGAVALRLAGPALAGLAQAACSARDEGAEFRVLAPHEAGDFAAIAARLIPTTETPGATEAGVIHFIDHAFDGAMKDRLPAAREGLAAFNAALAGTYPGKHSLTDLDAEEQDAFLTTREGDDFFELVRTMTIFGFFAMENYGGNRGHVGWDLIGFEGHHGAWQYPFGYYDAAYHSGAGDDE